MHASHILSLGVAHQHDSPEEGVRIGLIMATITWLWIALVDVASGHPFHTFAALGGIAAFTVLHFLLNIVYGITIVTIVHDAERTPSAVFALIFGMVIFEVAMAMLTKLLTAIAVGSIGWVAIFVGSLIGTGTALTLMARTHPLGKYLHSAEVEI
jgi:hypothetical protein